MSEQVEARSRMHQCPSKTVLSIEHPGRVLNVEKAVETLGGPEALRNMADDPTLTPLELRFRPQDRFEHPIISSTTRSSNLLIKVMSNVVDPAEGMPSMGKLTDADCIRNDKS